MEPILPIIQADLKTLAMLMVLTSFIVSLSAAAVFMALEGKTLVAKTFIWTISMLIIAQVLFLWEFKDVYRNSVKTEIIKNEEPK